MAPNHSNANKGSAEDRLSIKEVLEGIAYAASVLTISIVVWWFAGDIVHDFFGSIKHDLKLLAYP